MLNCNFCSSAEKEKLVTHLRLWRNATGLLVLKVMLGGAYVAFPIGTFNMFRNSDLNL